MNKIQYILLLFPIVIHGQKDIKVGDDIILWEERVFLQPEDFRIVKEVDPYDTRNGLTTYKIEILPREVLVDENNQIANFLKMNLAIYFYKNKSWLGKKNDKQLLAHEQNHFNIGELFARKMRKAFEELKEKKIKDFNAYQNVYTTYWKECKAYQRKYDQETFNGTLAEPSGDWLLKVDQELYELEEYTYTKVKQRWRAKLKKSSSGS